MTDCPGNCNARYRKLEASGDEHEVIARPGEPVWCAACTASIRFNLGRLPELAAQVAERRDGHLNRARDTLTDYVDTSASANTRSLSPGWENAEETVQWARSWAEVVADHLGHHGPLKDTTAGVAARNLTETTTYLRMWLTEALDSPFALDLGNETVQMAGNLERAAGRDRYVQRLPIRCPHCHTRTLTRDDGSAQIDCRRCDGRWPESDYARLATIVKWEHTKGA